MGISSFWMRRGRRHKTGVREDPQTETTLRAALIEPTAPGEEESYHRLMTVVADDLRLRQPVRQHNWGWIPTTSVAFAGVILAVMAYDAGVQHGIDTTARQLAQQARVTIQDGGGSKVPWNVYVPPKDKKTNPSAPKLSVKELPNRPADESDNVILAWMPLDGLTRDQRDLLGIAEKKASASDWEGAAKALVQMADQDTTSDAAINALYDAAVIQNTRLHHNSEALDLYQRAVQLCNDQLSKTQDPDRLNQLIAWRGRAELEVRLLTAASAADPNAPPAPK